MMKIKVRNYVIAGIILFLMPLLITLVLSGKDVLKLKKRLNMEIYLPMIMSKQIPGEYEDEMLKAQAVLARSSLYFLMDHGELDKKELKQELTRFQKQKKNKEFCRSYEKMEKAVEETHGQILTYKGQVCPGVFHRISSGETRDGLEVMQDENMGFLHSVDSSADLQAVDYMKGYSFSQENLRKIIGEYYPECTLTEKPLNEQLSIEKRDSKDYVTEIKLGDQLISGEAFRQNIGLPSSNFIVQEQEETIRFLCKGQGHGLGLSQYGGNELAKQGKTYKQILFFYFPKIALQKKTIGK